MTKYEERKNLWKAFNEAQKASYEKWAKTEEGKACLEREKKFEKK